MMSNLQPLPTTVMPTAVGVLDVSTEWDAPGKKRVQNLVGAITSATDAAVASTGKASSTGIRTYRLRADSDDAEPLAHPSP